MNTALARVDAPLEFTPEQSQMIRDSFANGATEQEFRVLMEVAKARRLNPLLRQIHFVKRWDSAKGRDVWSTQVSIDGLRAVADRTGEYDGQDEPEFIYNAEKLLLCAKVRIWRKGIPRAFVGVAHFDEYAQRKKGGELTQFWREKPHVMLAKCAEALGIRKGFPEDTAGLYVPEEMGQADGETTATAAPQHVTAPVLPPKVAETKTPEALAAEVKDYERKMDEAKTLAELKAIGNAINQACFDLPDREHLSLVYVERKKALATPQAAPIAERAP